VFIFNKAQKSTFKISQLIRLSQFRADKKHALMSKMAKVARIRSKKPPPLFRLAQKCQVLNQLDEPILISSSNKRSAKRLKNEFLNRLTKLNISRSWNFSMNSVIFNFKTNLASQIGNRIQVSNYEIEATCFEEDNHQFENQNLTIWRSKKLVWKLQMWLVILSFSDIVQWTQKRSLWNSNQNNIWEIWRRKAD